jgi:hypothetical protein
MPAALPTRTELHHQLTLARATMILAEDTGDWQTADEARQLCDELLDLLRELPHNVDV